MVGKIVTFIQKEITGLHEAAYLLGIAAVGSQLLALLRDRLLAHTFGAGNTLDLYYAAFRVPDFLFATIASLVSASVLIPFLAHKFAESHETGKKFFDVIFTVFFVAIVTAAAIAFFAAPALIPLLLPGFRDPASLQILVNLTRILLVSPILLGFSNLFASITQLRSRFFIYAISPLVYNIGIIVGVLVFVPLWGLYGLACGVVLGAFLHMAVQIPFIVSEGLRPSFVRMGEWWRARQAILLSVPRTLAISSSEIAEFFLISLASLLSAGSISVFNFSFNLQSVPLSIIGVSYSLAAFPTMAKYISEGNSRKYVEYVVTATRHIIFLCLPVAALFVVLRAQVVRVVLGSGKFSWDDTRLTAALLAIFVLSLVSQSLVLLFTRARYSTGDTKRPVLINVVSSVIIVALAFILLRIYSAVPVFAVSFARLFRVEDIVGTSVLMLPLAFSIGITIAALWHIASFHREFKVHYEVTEKVHMRLVFRTFVESFFSAVVMGVGAYVALNVLDTVFFLETFIGIFAQGLFSGLFGIVVGIIFLKIVGNTEIEEMWRTAHRKFWKARVVGPDAEDVI